MKKAISELQQKSVSELEKEVLTLRSEIAKLNVDRVVNPPKDTNTKSKKTKRLSQVLTVLSTVKKTK